MAEDIWKEIVIKQGYVPKGCTLQGSVVWGLINRSEDPCGGCYTQRSVCGGRPPDEDYEAKARILIDLENEVLRKKREGKA